VPEPPKDGYMLRHCLDGWCVSAKAGLRIARRLSCSSSRFTTRWPISRPASSIQRHRSRFDHRKLRSHVHQHQLLLPQCAILAHTDERHRAAGSNLAITKRVYSPAAPKYLRKKLSAFHCGRCGVSAIFISSSRTMSSYFPAAARSTGWFRSSEGA